MLLGLLLIFPLGAETAGPTATPAPFAVAYSLSTHGLRFATMTRHLSRQADGDYIFESQSRATGLAKLIVPGQITEQSRWNVAGNQIYSRSYSYVRTGSEPKSITVRFDWSNGLILGSNGTETWRLDARSGLLDKLSYQLAIMSDLQAGKRLLEYTFVDEDEIKVYRFATVGEEVLETPIGKLKTLKLERTNEKPNRFTTLWCAPALRYLPVRLDKRKNGATDTAMIESFSGLR
ncbi:MAG: DUF3108 domain-containing protein [Gammaproteobacteria bacterium]